MSQRWTEADVMAHTARMGRKPVAGLGETAAASSRKASKYRAIPCIVTADLTIFTAPEIQQLARTKGVIESSIAVMPLKDLARALQVVGLYFHSTKEGQRYIELSQQQRQGWISALETQPAFPLLVTAPDGSRVPVGTFTADFRYIDSAKLTHIEDVKSKPTLTEAYQLRKKHAEAQYSIVIEEIG